MTRMKNFILLPIAVFICASAVHAEIINIKDAPFAAIGDGHTDDLPGLKRALLGAKPGDTVMIPEGRYRMVLTGGALAIPEGVTLWGQSGKSKFLLSTDGKTSDYREFLLPKSDVTVEGLVMERDADFPCVLLPISGTASNITFRNCRIIGGQARFPQRYCHGFRVGVGRVKNLTFEGLAIVDCCYGLFQPNNATGTLDNVLVEQSTFTQNTASDLEFNSPNGVMSNIVVRECFFRDNLSKSAGGGFAVGFAHVKNGRVEACQIRNYPSEALHVEDRSTEIQLVGNTIIGGSTRQPNGVIMVLSDSKRVNIEGNFIDARPNTNNVHLVLATSGGKDFACPSDVSLRNNVLVNGCSTRTWYLQEGSGPAPSGNLVFPERPAASTDKAK